MKSILRSIRLFLLATLSTILALNTSTADASSMFLSVSPSTVQNDYVGKVTLTITGIPAGKTVLVERYADFNGNGKIDSGTDYLIRSFKVTDGVQPLIGGVRNVNVAGDEDTTAAQITVKLDFPGIDPITDSASGTFLFRVSDPQGSLGSVTNAFTVTQKGPAQGVNQGIQGQITLNGSPVPYAFMVLQTQNGPPITGTQANATGNYTIYTQPGSYNVFPVKSGLLADLTQSQVTVVTNQTTVNNQSMITGSFAVSGAVTDPATSAGLPAVLISSEGTNNALGVAFTDANGNYSLSLTTSQWKLGLESPQLTQIGYVAPQKTQTYISGATTINLTAKKADALFYGTVSNNIGGVIGPFPGIDMTAQDTNNLYKSESFSLAPDGRYALGVVGGTQYSAGTTSDKIPGGYSPVSSNLTINAGQAIQLNLILQGAAAYLQGQIKDDSGNPIGFASLVVQPFPITNSAGNGSINISTDGAGNFNVGVNSAGTWNIALECNSAQQSGYVNEAGPSYNLTVANGATNSGNTLVFPKSTSTISGTVKNNTGGPIVGVTLDASQTINGNSFYFPGCVVTDANGHYSINVISGTWNVVPRADDPQNIGLKQLGYAPVASISVAAGTTTANFIASPLSNISISPSSLNNGTVNSSYNATLSASGGQQPYTWSFDAGFLPSGLFLNQSSGQITGTPGEGGNFRFTVRATDSTMASASMQYLLSVNAGTFPAPFFTNIFVANGMFQGLLGGVAGQTYSIEFSTNLVNWFPGGDGITVNANLTAINDDSHLVSRFDHLFYRLRIGREFSASLQFVHYASAGHFGSGFTPSFTPGVSISDYRVFFQPVNDPSFPSTNTVTFTGPSGSGLSGGPTDPSNFYTDSQKVQATYESLDITSPSLPQGGAWQVAYHGTNITFNVPNPQSASRLVIPLPTVTVSSGTLTSLTWVYKDPNTGNVLSPAPAFMTQIQVQIEDQNLGRVYNSPNLSATTTSHTLSQTVNWNTITSIAMAYDDDLGNSYVVFFQRP